MKKKVSLIVLTLGLLMLVAAVPVMAEPTKGLKVEASLQATSMPTVLDPGTSRWTKSGVFHGKGFTESYNALLTIGGIPHDVVTVFVEDGSWNPQTEIMVLESYDVLYVGGMGSSNGFSGNSHVKLYGWDWATLTWSLIDQHAVFHGFGSFAGQTLTLSYEKGPGGVMTGYCLKG